MRYIQFHPDEWLAGIAGMSPEDQGIYWLVCALIYSSGGPISSDDPRLKSLCGCHGNRLRASLDRLERGRKIARNGLEIDQKRSRNELERSKKRSRHASEIASKRWNINTIDDGIALLPSSATRALTTNHKLKKDSHPLPSLEKPSPSEPSDSEFAKFWEACPRKIGKGQARRAYIAARKKIAAGDLLNAVRMHATQCAETDQRFIPHPATWLNGERWADETTPAINGEIYHHEKPDIAETDRSWNNFGDAHSTTTDGQWRRRLAATKAGRHEWWDEWGAAPGYQSCHCPDHILAEYGYIRPPKRKQDAPSILPPHLRLDETA